MEARSRADAEPFTTLDAILIPAGAPHQIHADADAELRFLCCCAPPYSDKDTFLEGEDR